VWESGLASPRALVVVPGFSQSFLAFYRLFQDFGYGITYELDGYVTYLAKVAVSSGSGTNMQIWLDSA
jgi:hypothetical protein